MRAVTSGDSIYFLIQYADPTESAAARPVPEAGRRSWKKLKDPADQGGDDNVYYEDKWSIIWNVDDSIGGFNKTGCAVLCHTGESKPFGNKYTTTWRNRRHVAPQGLAQRGVRLRRRPVRRPHALRLRRRRRTRAQGRPGGPDYKGFNLVNGKPEFMNKDGKAANRGGRYYIKDGDQVAFVDKFQPATRFPPTWSSR
jgi:hypothetical protein